MIPTPILTVLSTFRKNGVQTLLMGGQACVFYGAAQVNQSGPGRRSEASVMRRLALDVGCGIGFYLRACCTQSTLSVTSRAGKWSGTLSLACPMG